jgi:hypothetical protein
MSRLARAICFLLALCLWGCAAPDDERRSAMEAGGSLPWNRPAQWETGALGVQMQGTP